MQLIIHVFGQPRRKGILLLLYFLWAGMGAGLGQTGSEAASSGAALLTRKDSSDLARERDLIDTYDKLFKGGRDTHLKDGAVYNSPFPAVGYTQVTGTAAVLSDRLDFYTGKPLESKESDILSSFTYSQYDQIIAQSYASLWTKGDKYNIIADWRYMKYPSTTYGLGGHSNYSDGYTIDFRYVKIHTTILRRVARNLYAGLGYYFDYLYKIQEVNPPPGIITSFQRYGLTPTEEGSGPVVRVLYDSRINAANPFNGWYASAVYHRSLESLGSQGNWGNMQIDVRKYFALRPDNRNVLALWSFDWRSVGGKTPYLLLPSTGWDDLFNTGRGYIQGRFRGSDMTYLEAEDRITLSRNGMFGMVIFANAQAFTKNLASQFTSIAPGYGAGIRIKLNKNSGTNICVDYGFGLPGSGGGIAVNVGEVF
jgi:hypothetical protein